MHSIQYRIAEGGRRARASDTVEFVYRGTRGSDYQSVIVERKTAKFQQHGRRPGKL